MRQAGIIASRLGMLRLRTLYPSPQTLRSSMVSSPSTEKPTSSCQTPQATSWESTFTASFAGDALYNPSSASATLTVKKADVLTTIGAVGGSPKRSLG
ncbi:MAG: hypothetical protein NT023_24425 [Armatimonadetes bacterium]|nr:hypothetical protein [Armatimonadota bacterium]